MKFGGAALENPAQFLQAADIILEKIEVYDRLVVVVSAMGEMTDELMALTKKITLHPSKREQDMLISVGERISMALLAMALADRQIKAISLTGSQSGIITCSSHLDAKIRDVRPSRLLRHLEEGKVVIVAGFQGVSDEKEITTLGRGGSDTSAVALGVALGAEKVVFYKDVSGFYPHDPKKKAEGSPFPEMSFKQAAKLAEENCSPLHLRSILLASKNGLPLHVLSFRKEMRNRFPGTIIGGKGAAARGEPIYENSIGVIV